MTENTITIMVPLLNEDPEDDPTDEELLILGTEGAEEIATTRGMRAIDVRRVERLPGLYDDEGHYALDEYGGPISPRSVIFTAEAVQP